MWFAVKNIFFFASKILPQSAAPQEPYLEGVVQAPIDHSVSVTLCARVPEEHVTGDTHNRILSISDQDNSQSTDDQHPQTLTLFNRNLSLIV